MPLATRLETFLTGPLSDRSGGSESIRKAIAECTRAETTGSNGQQGTDRIGVGPQRFVLTSPNPLFAYQQEIVDRLGTWISDRKQRRAALVSLPTGGGKTRTGIWFFRHQVHIGNVKRLLWVAPSTELVHQAVETAKSLWTHFASAPPVNVTVDSLTPARSRLTPEISICFVTAQLAAKRPTEVSRFGADVLIFDEAHQCVARTFRAVVRCQLLTERGCVVGLSATPGRTLNDESDDLQDLFGDNLITSTELGSNPVAALRQMGVLSELEIEKMPLPARWERSRVTSGSRRSMSAEELAVHPPRFWSTVETLLQLKRGSKTLVFCESVAHCYALTGALCANGVSAAVISHRTPPAKRAIILTRFAAGEINVLVNKSILATGYDCPKVTDVVLATPIRSAILWEQILGRASRGPAVGGTRVGHIWELDDHQGLHGRVLSYARYRGTSWS